MPTKVPQSQSGPDVVVGVSSANNRGVLTARQAGGLTDLKLSISPSAVGERKALQNLAKAINVALKENFIETPLDGVYKGARVRHGAVQILHAEYIGLGDGLMARLGKTAKSFQLTLKGPDAASPEGKEWIDQNGAGSVSGILNLIGRKLNVLQEFEDKLPVYTEQLLDRLETKQIIVDWNRDDWEISTTLIGLDVVITPAGTDAD